MDKHDEAVFGSHHAQDQGLLSMTRRQRRLTMIGGSLAVLAVAAALVLNAMRDSIVFFSTPAMVAEKHIQAGKRFPLRGPGQPGALVRGHQPAVTFQGAHRPPLPAPAHT